MKHKTNRRDFIKAAGLAAASLAIQGCMGNTKPSAAQTSTDKPNIIFIMADDLGYGDLSCYGATKVRTTNIDRIAAEGMRFTDAHTPAAVCSPTRYGVLTGRYCWRSRLKKGVCRPNAPLLLEKDRTTVASMLKAAGYTTACVGKWHLGFGQKKPNWNGELKPGPLEVGFDYYFGVPVSNNWPPFVYVENHYVLDRREDEVIEVIGTGEKQPIPPKRRHEQIALVQTDKVVKFIERNKDKPFFLYFPICNIHLPLTPNKKFRGTSQMGIRGDFIHEADWSVGAILKTLDRLNLTNNTLIIFTSDNGARTDQNAKYGHKSCGELRGQKADIWEGGHRVPFVARWPGRIKTATTTEQTICLTDLIATSAAIVGEKLPENAAEDSYNILPVLLGQELDGPIREAIVHHSGSGMFAIRRGKWKLILGRGSGGFSNPKTIKPKLSEPEGQLYNLQEDFAESKNLWDEYPQIVDRLTKLLEKYRKQGYSRTKRS